MARGSKRAGTGPNQSTKRGSREPGATGMRAHVRNTDWSATPLGSRKNWPASLNLVLELIMASGFPMAVRWGPDLIMIYNDAYGRLLGDKHPAAFARPLREVWPEIYDRLGPLNESILRGESPAFFAEDHPWTIERRAGRREEARFTISYSPIPDPGAPDGIGGVLTTAFETTERVRGEKRLHELTSRLEAEVAERTRERDRIWQVSEDLLGIANFEGFFTAINPAWSKLLGWSEDDIKSMHISELRHPDDAAAGIAGRARLLEGVPTVRLENRFRHKDGSWRWIAWTMTADRGLIYVAGRHVTAEKEIAEALRESERQFRLLVAGVTDYALLMLDPNGIVTSWNAGAERIKGYAASEIVGQHFSRFYTESDRAAGLPARSLYTATQEGRVEAEGWRVRKDGSVFWANAVIDAIRDEDGRLIAFAKITRDITERREAQAALQKVQAERAQLQKMDALGQLTGGVAHDFNNLLMIVTGHMATIKKAVGQDPKALRAVAAIEIAAGRGQSLTRQLLTFARRQAFNPEVVAIGSQIEGVRPILMSSIGAAAKLVINVAPDIWNAKVDANEFELALVNLTLNARDAMAHGGVIRIGAANVQLRPGEVSSDLAGDFVAVSVSDTGEGIAPDILERVFEPFFTTKPIDKGTGLGLSQVHGFAHQSGGAVTIESELGKGTTVRIYLPRAQAVRSRAVAETPAEPAAGGTALLVEDNPEVAEVTAALLKQLGYEVRTATDAASALDLMHRERFALVLSDIVMAGVMDGLALARAIRRNNPDLPIILATGYAQSATRAAAEFVVLRKPYQLPELTRAAAAARQSRSDKLVRLKRPG